MVRIRPSTVLTAAIVLLIAWLASRTRLDIGIAVAILGLLLAYARGMVAIPAAALVAAVACAPGTVAKVAFFLLISVPALAFVVVLVHRSAVFGSTTSWRGSGPGGEWWGFEDGWGRGRWPR
jgi:hypothetical protein